MNEQNNLKKELRKLREDIDKIDDDLVDLLNERGSNVIKIGNLKKKFPKLKG